MKSKTKKKTVKKSCRAVKSYMGGEPCKTASPEFIEILSELEAETVLSGSVGLDINNRLHSIKYNSIDKEEGEAVPKENDDLAGKFREVLQKLKAANKMHQKNYYKLNQLF